MVYERLFPYGDEFRIADPNHTSHRTGARCHRRNCDVGHHPDFFVESNTDESDADGTEAESGQSSVDVVQKDASIVHTNTNGSSRYLSPAICRVNCKLRKETLPLYIQRTDFEASTKTQEEIKSCTAWLNWLQDLQEVSNINVNITKFEIAVLGPFIIDCNTRPGYSSTTSECLWSWAQGKFLTSPLFDPLFDKKLEGVKCDLEQLMGLARACSSE